MNMQSRARMWKSQNGRHMRLVRLSDRSSASWGRHVRLSVAVCALWMAGCAVDTKRDVAAYRRILDNNALPRLTSLPDGPLSLEQAFALANRNSEQLARSGEDYVQALIDKSRAVANFLPTISFQPSYALAQKPRGAANSLPLGPTDSGTYRVQGGTMHTLQAPLVGGINLFRGGGDAASLRAAEQIIAGRRDLLLDLQATVLLDVAQAYYQVLRSEKSVEVLAQSVQLQEARLRDVQQQFKNGLAIRLSVSQTRAQLDAVRVELVQARSDVRNGRSTLAYLVGAPALPNPLVDDSGAIPSRLPPEADFESRAMRDRQDYLAAHHAVEAARQRVKVAVSEFYPSVSLNVEAFIYRQFYADASKWDGILFANIPLFSAGTIKADVRTAWSQLRQAALDESAVRRQTLHDVRIAYENLATAGQRVTQLEDEVKAAADAFHQSQQAFHNQLAINLDVLTAQDRLLAAQLQLTGARFDRAVFYLDLKRAAGRLVPQRPPATVPTTTPPQDQ
jgi:outer membrane protein